MRRVHLVIVAALVGGGALIGAAQAGEHGYFSHSWGVTSHPINDVPEDTSWRLFTGRRQLSNETPWAGVPTTLVSDTPSEEFHRQRSFDPQNPWGQGVVSPSLPALPRGPLDSHEPFQPVTR